ncbi:plasmid stabilization protein [Enterovibrio norvegicus]|uniref:plasmid stabilization protein n=1 Tax=Enterovibrio norvegicus TaxID=188144 RepID=UPI000C85AB5A|nr:plasmid stabilization protein [Enterovibrio norvegicus]PMH64550.1 hypothetical protein BCU62_15965 [Enterovibrio norvegicus]
MTVNVEYTRTFEQSADMAISHFAEYVSEKQAIEKIENIIDHFEEKVLRNPKIYSRCATLSNIGITSVREAKIDGMRLLYELSHGDGDTVITAHILLSQKQQLEEQLINYCLIYR